MTISGGGRPSMLFFQPHLRLRMCCQLGGEISDHFRELPGEVLRFEGIFLVIVKLILGRVVRLKEFPFDQPVTLGTDRSSESIASPGVA